MSFAEQSLLSYLPLLSFIFFKYLSPSLRANANIYSSFQNCNLQTHVCVWWYFASSLQHWKLPDFKHRSDYALLKFLLTRRQRDMRWCFHLLTHCVSNSSASALLYNQFSPLLSSSLLWCNTFTLPLSLSLSLIRDPPRPPVALWGCLIITGHSLLLFCSCDCITAWRAFLFLVLQNTSR